MKINLTYLTDSNGKQKAIQMSIKEWNRFHKEFQKLLEFKKIKMDIHEAANEIKQIESGEKSYKILKQFLDAS
ncbi:MAG: hypothetical protein ABI462_03455 [Ignavibacteria bacterium]